MKKYNIIIALLTVALCVLGFITYQQQNYIESLSQSIKKNNPSTKELNSRMQEVEDTILDMQSNLDDLEYKVTGFGGLEDSVIELGNEIDSLESDLDYLLLRLNLY